MRWPMTILLVLAPLLLQACGDRAPEGATVLRAARLYVAPDQPPIDDAAILIVDGRIAAAGPRKEIASAGAATFRLCDGGTVVAGFQNSHVHFTEPKFADAATRPAAELAAALDDMLNRFGFTTVVDTASSLANTVALRTRVDANKVAGPRILTAGGALYPKNGIPIYLNDLPPEFLALLSQPGSVEEALASVEANIDGGADATKLFLMTPQAGGQLLFGTDVGYMADYDPTEEYRLMARALSTTEILASLTTAPAARWNEKERRGRVEYGLDADLVVLEADPAVDAANFAKVRCTIRGGRLIHGPKKG